MPFEVEVDIWNTGDLPDPGPTCSFLYETCTACCVQKRNEVNQHLRQGKKSGIARSGRLGVKRVGQDSTSLCMLMR